MLCRGPGSTPRGTAGTPSRVGLRSGSLNADTTWVRYARVSRQPTNRPWSCGGSAAISTSSSPALNCAQNGGNAAQNGYTSAAYLHASASFDEHPSHCARHTSLTHGATSIGGSPAGSNEASEPGDGIEPDDEAAVELAEFFSEYGDGGDASPTPLVSYGSPAAEARSPVRVDDAEEASSVN